VTAGDVAALIAEPIQGVGGFVAGPDGLLGAYQKVLAEHGILLIADEVQTGWGRTGEHFWGYQAHGVTPDLITFAKGIGNGFALGGVVGRAAVMNAVDAISFSTFGGNPVSAAAGNAVLDYVLDHDLQGNAARVGSILLDGLRALDLPIIGEVRGKGLMLGMELVTDRDSKIPAKHVCDALITRAYHNGLILLSCGQSTVRFMPPLMITTGDVDEAVGILELSLAEVLNDKAA
jgi:4-aminobutyrate aminotransferase